MNLIKMWKVLVLESMIEKLQLYYGIAIRKISNRDVQKMINHTFQLNHTGSAPEMEMDGIVNLIQKNRGYKEMEWERNIQLSNWIVVLWVILQV